MAVRSYKESRRHAVRGDPRYRFSHDDQNLMRFTTSRTRRIVPTHIFDISQSGISFTTHKRIAPDVGELIKMDFAPMGTFKMACVGKVVRVEQASAVKDWAEFPSTVKVGVTFHNMPETYRKMLATLLTDRLTQNGKSTRSGSIITVQRMPLASAIEWVSDNIWSLIITAALMIFVGVSIFVLMSTSETERPRTDSAWASGFFEKVIVKPPHK